MSKDWSIESIVGMEKYSTPQHKGIGGVIKQRNEDFIVREILPSGNPIFTGSEIGQDQGGLYTHCILWKSGLDTFNAIKKICNILGINENDIGYAGLKDASAETYQRISVWNVGIEQIKAINMDNLKLFHPIRQKFAIRIGNLKGNYFKIVIRNIERDWSQKEWASFKNQLNTNGLLNYYGLQRFGSKRPLLHFIGKKLLQERYSEIIEKYIGEISPLEHENIIRLRQEYSDAHSYGLLREKFPRKYTIERMLLSGLQKGFSFKKNVLGLPRSFLRLSISAYQAFLYNRVLSSLNVDDLSLLKDKQIPLAGYKSQKQETTTEIWDILVSILEAESVDFEIFNHNQNFLRSKGTLRRAVIFPTEFTFKKNEDIEKQAIKISFALAKGSYATIVTREIIKKGLSLSKDHLG